MGLQLPPSQENGSFVAPIDNTGMLISSSEGTQKWEFSRKYFDRRNAKQEKCRVEKSAGLWASQQHCCRRGIERERLRWRSKGEEIIVIRREMK